MGFDVITKINAINECDRNSLNNTNKTFAFINKNCSGRESDFSQCKTLKTSMKNCNSNKCAKVTCTLNFKSEI